MPSLPELIQLIPPKLDGADGLQMVIIGFQIFVAVIIVFVLFPMCITGLTLTLNPPKPPTGLGKTIPDYDAAQTARGSLADYMKASGISEDTPMVQFSVATANFGGIFTEPINPPLYSWIGTVSSEAARLQVEAGARAIVFDIWPDPANPAMPIVAAMKDSAEWGSISWWRAHGLDKGMGRYSNWQRLTRNSVPVGDVIRAATDAAFGSATSNQKSDPFFIILNLHGAMTVEYLNYLGNTVLESIGPHRLGAEWNKANNQKQLCNEPVRTFMNKACIIVCPDIQPGFNALPNINTWDGFKTQFLATTLGEATNVLEQGPNTVRFDPGNVAAITTANQANCQLGGPNLTPAQAGFCVVQPSIGGTTTNNKDLYTTTTYDACLKSGAQFVAVNLFSEDDVSREFFDEELFAKYSFKKGV